ncbi:unnamed protein product [Cuscuta campestris]|uniref:Uncharacterized protein n=1 Tax=Cuscuta campestris TaxID=132261 RepID=A0A484KHS0_9ASTE|nr:unnamed protein product [Cuscuta campestris]
MAQEGIGKEGLMAAKELKRLHSSLERFIIKSSVSRLLKSDLVAILAEFQRQELVFLSMKVSPLSHPLLRRPCASQHHSLGLSSSPSLAGDCLSQGR